MRSHRDLTQDEGRSIFRYKQLCLQQMSQQDILMVLMEASEEHEADMLTKHVPRLACTKMKKCSMRRTMTDAEIIIGTDNDRKQGPRQPVDAGEEQEREEYVTMAILRRSV